ncbi:MAG: MMPL family transporter [Acidimicrobiia bacterium]|nr:MMPL family transporter [Acidimicrobiia bacterium]
MKTLVRLLSGMVSRSPWGIIVGTLIVTLVLGAFLPQQETATGNEGFSPDSPEFLAQDVIADYFQDSSEEPVQVVVRGNGGADLITVAGLQDYLTIRQAIADSEASQLFRDRPGGDIVGYLDPLLQGLQIRADEMGIPFETLVANLTDNDVKQGLLQSLEQTPPEFRGLVEGLYGSSSDLSVPQAQTGLMVVFLNVADLDDPDFTILQGIEVDMADAITSGQYAVAEPSAFSFALLFADTSEFDREIGRLFGTAFLIIIAILMFVYWIHPKGKLTRLRALRRALADMALTMLVIVVSIVWMNGIGVILGPKYLNIIGNFSEILQIVPILLIGLGVDYAIHMTSRYREELGAGIAITESAAQATKTVGVALVLATATTSVGFLTNVVNPVTALRDFGILAAVGITSAFVLMLTVVPAIRTLLDKRAEAAGHLERDAFGHQSERLLPRLMGSTAVLAERYAITTLIAAAILGIAGFIGLTQLDTTFSFTDFVPEGNELLTTFDTITEEFSGGFGEETEVIIEGDVATPDVHNALVAAWTNMGNTENVIQFGSRAAAESPVSAIAQLVLPPDQGGNPETFNADFAEFAFGAGLQQDLTVAPGTDVAALYDEAFVASPDVMARTIAEVDGAYRFVDVGVSTQAGEAGASQLSKDLKEDFEPVAAAGVTAVPTNQNIISSGVVTALQDSQASSLAITILAAMALLMLTFYIEVRRPGLGVITILPVVLIVLWVFGVMSARGISFNPVTAMIANLAIGIGVPYTIHITHRYEEDRQRYDNPEEAIRSTTTHTGGALAGSAFTTAAGFGILMTSTLKPFQQLGEVTFWAIIFALVASVLVLPSMLVVWDRWHRRRGEDVVDQAAYERAHAGL